MAWPIDDRYETMAAGGRVPAAMLNAMQDRIVDVHRERTKIFFRFNCEAQTAGAVGAWTVQGSTYAMAIANESNKDLFIPIELPEGSIINSVTVKLQVASSAGIRAYFGKMNTKHSDATGTPTWSAITSPAASGGAGPRWEVVDVSPGSPATVAADELYFVRIGSNTINDMFAGVQVTYEPFTPTP